MLRRFMIYSGLFLMALCIWQCSCARDREMFEMRFFVILTTGALGQARSCSWPRQQGAAGTPCISISSGHASPLPSPRSGIHRHPPAVLRLPAVSDIQRWALSKNLWKLASSMSLCKTVMNMHACVKFVNLHCIVNCDELAFVKFVNLHCELWWIK